jgi:hypothetical protein
VDLADDRGFAGDPQVLWSLIEAALRELSETGDRFVLRARTDGNGGVRVRIRSDDDSVVTPGSAASLRLSLGSAIRVEREIITAVAQHLGIGYQRNDADAAVTIAVQWYPPSVQERGGAGVAPVAVLAPLPSLRGGWPSDTPGRHDGTPRAGTSGR